MRLGGWLQVVGLAAYWQRMQPVFRFPILGNGVILFDVPTTCSATEPAG